MINEKLEDRLRTSIRHMRYYHRREEIYAAWYKRFVLWHGKRHPSEMATPEVEAFLTHLAENLGLGAGSQNQA